MLVATSVDMVVMYRKETLCFDSLRAGLRGAKMTERELKKGLEPSLYYSHLVFIVM